MKTKTIIANTMLAAIAIGTSSFVKYHGQPECVSTANILTKADGNYTMYDYSKQDLMPFLRTKKGEMFQPVQVKDPDGWTNIRKSNSKNSRIVYRVKSGSWLLMWNDCTCGMSWIPVYDAKGRELGYIHDSRLIIENR